MRTQMAFQRAVLLCGLTLLAPLCARTVNAQTVTFSKDVAPILQQKCVQCHRPGEMAPMALRTYQEARPWARSIKNKVSRREMPPWFVDRNIGIQKFKNDGSLSAAEIDTLVNGSMPVRPRATHADMPQQRVFPDSGGWGIGTPDLVVTQEKTFTMYAAGSDWWETFTVDTGLTEDRWIKAVQLKPEQCKNRPPLLRRTRSARRSNPNGGDGGALEPRINTPKNCSAPPKRHGGSPERATSATARLPSAAPPGPRRAGSSRRAPAS